MEDDDIDGTWSDDDGDSEKEESTQQETNGMTKEEATTFAEFIGSISDSESDSEPNLDESLVDLGGGVVAGSNFSIIEIASDSETEPVSVKVEPRVSRIVDHRTR